jgi:hypothetical protein
LATPAEKTAGFIRGFYIYTLTTKDIKHNLPSSGILRSNGWYLHTDLSEKPAGPIFKDQEIAGFFAENLSRNVGKELTLYAA